jgi:hypothetical protein
VRNVCRESTKVAVEQPIRYTAFSKPLSVPRTYIGLGHVDIPAYVLTGKTATLDARVWDVFPDGGPQLLMDRGTYRIDPPGYDPVGGSIELPLFGNQWTLDAGHQVRLDLTLVDSPSFLPSNQAGTTLTFSPPTLVLPTREATELTLQST